NGKKAVTAFDEAIHAATDTTIAQQVEKFEHVGGVPFEPARRRASVLMRTGTSYRLVVRGAYEELIKESRGLAPQQIQEIHNWVAAAGTRGERVVAITMREFAAMPQDLIAAEQDMTWLGVLAFQDPIKKSTFEAITQARQMGIQIKILTGDSPE